MCAVERAAELWAALARPLRPEALAHALVAALAAPGTEGGGLCCEGGSGGADAWLQARRGEAGEQGAEWAWLEAALGVGRADRAAACALLVALNAEQTGQLSAADSTPALDLPLARVSEGGSEVERGGGGEGGGEAAGPAQPPCALFANLEHLAKAVARPPPPGAAAAALDVARVLCGGEQSDSELGDCEADDAHSFSSESSSPAVEAGAQPQQLAASPAHGTFAGAASPLQRGTPDGSHVHSGRGTSASTGSARGRLERGALSRHTPDTPQSYSPSSAGSARTPSSAGKSPSLLHVTVDRPRRRRTEKATGARTVEDADAGRALEWETAAEGEEAAAEASPLDLGSPPGQSPPPSSSLRAATRRDARARRFLPPHVFAALPALAASTGLPPGQLELRAVHACAELLCEAPHEWLVARPRLCAELLCILLEQAACDPSANARTDAACALDELVAALRSPEAQADSADHGLDGCALGAVSRATVGVAALVCVAAASEGESSEHPCLAAVVDALAARVVGALGLAGEPAAGALQGCVEHAACQRALAPALAYVRTIPRTVTPTATEPASAGGGLGGSRCAARHLLLRGLARARTSLPAEATAHRTVRACALLRAVLALTGEGGGDDECARWCARALESARVLLLAAGLGSDRVRAAGSGEWRARALHQALRVSAQVLGAGVRCEPLWAAAAYLLADALTALTAESRAEVSQAPTAAAGVGRAAERGQTGRSAEWAAEQAVWLQVQLFTGLAAEHTLPAAARALSSTWAWMPLLPAHSREGASPALAAALLLTRALGTVVPSVHAASGEECCWRPPPELTAYARRCEAAARRSQPTLSRALLALAGLGCSASRCAPSATVGAGCVRQWAHSVVVTCDVHAADLALAAVAALVRAADEQVRAGAASPTVEPLCDSALELSCALLVERADALRRPGSENSPPAEGTLALWRALLALLDHSRPARARAIGDLTRLILQACEAPHSSS
ncbi:hypothetical protein T492DRAFT_1039442 [Pavlovales sp. CCMP2436]|nr:hypothetical protein T492DRAFT_1039442 [Pavlovales sp. CCMP2436]